MLKKPKAKKWQPAELWQVGLWDNKYPLCGLRMLWVIVGTKHVQMAAPICETKMRMSRKEWNAMNDKERYHTEEDKEIYIRKKNGAYNYFVMNVTELNLYYTFENSQPVKQENLDSLL